MSDQISSTADELADDDPLLRAIAQAPAAKGLLTFSSLPEPLQRAFARAGGDPAAPPSPGTLIDGRYRIEGRLGAGGMGIVFVATHLQTQKSVALKWMRISPWLRGERERADAIRRFEREARIAGRVCHPNLVDIYDAASDGERSYLVMERLAGETLRARMERSLLSWEEALALIVPALRGVAALHAQGVIHRDLKPENIFLAQVGAGPQELCPKVLDFGVAALRGGEHSVEDESLTTPGSVLGTPGYMPIEQLRGERALDARTDVYALGVVFYEALSGRRPFRAGNAAEHAACIASEAPLVLGALRPELRGARSSAIMRALARDPQQRYASVDAFVAALFAARAGARFGGRAALLLGCAVASAGLALWLADGSERAAAAHPRRSDQAASTTESLVRAASAPPSSRASDAVQGASSLPAPELHGATGTLRRPTAEVVKSPAARAPTSVPSAPVSGPAQTSQALHRSPRPALPRSQAASATTLAREQFLVTGAELPAAEQAPRLLRDDF